MSRVLVTGGAGFIGSNLVNQLLSEGHQVTILDNLSRVGVKENVAWLREKFGSDAFQLAVADVTDWGAVQRAAEGVERIYHFASQVAVTTSVKDPRKDFETNASGTLNVLEAARLLGDNPIFIYSSTNKVYGAMEDVQIAEEDTRYRYADLPYGIPETRPLDFCSPYGCSKGAGDQYTHDYARIYGLRTVVMRQSCCYGYRQFGIEDQGWVAWLILAAIREKPITIYGNGKQMRDTLFIDDLLDVYDAAVKNIATSAGQVYNIGGGPNNTMSIWAEFGPRIEKLIGYPIPVQYADWRPGDQLVCVCDIRKAARELGWQPRISPEEGVGRLFEWIQSNKGIFSYL